MSRASPTFVMRNVRASRVGGVCFALMAAEFVFSGTSAFGSGGWVLVLLAVPAAAFALACWFGFVARVVPPNLELRRWLRTQVIPLRDVSGCVSTVGSTGLIYVRAYPEFVLLDGSRVPFSAINWSPSKVNSVAREECAQLLSAIELASSDR